MTRTIVSPPRADDAAIAYRDAIEARAIQAALDARGHVSGYAIVTTIKGETVALVTSCPAGERATWRELLGLHLPQGLAEDIDGDWGMAWVNQDGSMQMAGPNLEFAQLALRNLGTYQFTSDGTRLTIENNEQFDAPFAFIGKGGEGGSYHEDVCVLPWERQHVGELLGVDPDAWGMAWQPVSMHTDTSGQPQAEYHPVVVAIGSSTDWAYKAFADLVICQD